MKYHRSMLNGLLIACTFGVNIWAVEITDDKEATNIAGKQRMYTQRMLKDYAMIGMHNTFGDPVKELQRSIAAFDDHLAALKRYAKDPKIQQAITAVQASWEPIKKELTAPPALTQAFPLQKRLDELRTASDRIVKMLDTKEKSDIVDISGRQRMLSQRMAALYMLKVWGVKEPGFHQKLDTAIATFKQAHQRLEALSFNTPEIKTLLNKTKRAFLFFEMMNRSKSKFIPTLIYKKSDEMLKDMDKVTQQYVQIKSHQQ